MRPTAPEHQRWMVQPLLDAGLALDEIHALVLRLGFDAVVSPDPDLMAPVSDRPAEVRAAWAEMIDRMVAPDEGGG